MMKTHLVRIVTLATLAIGPTSYAQQPERPPVYRGAYYAFDAYPHGYQGYPGFPYYGAPFGYGGPAFAAAQQQVTVDTSKEMRTTHERRVTHKRSR